jgi:hypothetical protein
MRKEPQLQQAAFCHPARQCQVAQFSRCAVIAMSTASRVLTCSTVAFRHSARRTSTEHMPPKHRPHTSSSHHTLPPSRPSSHRQVRIVPVRPAGSKLARSCRCSSRRTAPSRRPVGAGRASTIVGIPLQVGFMPVRASCGLAWTSTPC